MNPTPQEPSPPLSAVTDSLDSFDILLEGPGDKTRRPRRRDIPGAPPQEQWPPPEKTPEAEKKPDGDQPKAP